MDDQYRSVIRQKIVDSLAAAVPLMTRRDVWLPTIAGKAIAVIGMRRSGKTTFLWQELADRLAHSRELASSHDPRSGLLYFSFEDERLAGMQSRHLSLIVEEYYRLHPAWRDQRRATFFLDEIQVVPDWEKFARRILDSENIDLFLSGSSARLLSREVATSMRGRALEAVVYPFSFRESLRHAHGEPPKNAEPYPKALRSRLDHQFRAYLRWGGFPEAQGLDSRTHAELLRSYVDVALLRDVVERHSVSHPLALRWMVGQLLGNAGGSFSINKFHGDLKSQGVAVGKDTLHHYLAHLEDAFLLRTLNVATHSVRRQRVNPRKIYPIDMGLIHLFDRSGKANLGHAFETAVLLELDRRGADCGYVKTKDGFEVDFYARFPDGREELIQVCANLDASETQLREVRALENASEDFPQAKKRLIAMQRPTVWEPPRGIAFSLAIDWFLASPEMD